MKSFVTALAVAAAVALFAQDAHAFGKRKCNTCQTVITCQPAPTTCRPVVTVAATPPTVVYTAPPAVFYPAPATVNWYSFHPAGNSCPNGRCPSPNR